MVKYIPYKQLFIYYKSRKNEGVHMEINIGIIAIIVLAIAIGSGCSYLTPIASGTNQTMLIFTKLKFQDFTRFGWPLLIISWICCVLILPQVFPFF